MEEERVEKHIENPDEDTRRENEDKDKG